MHYNYVTKEYKIRKDIKMIISNVSNENFMSAKLRVNCKFPDEKEAKYRDIYPDDIDCVEFQNSTNTAIITRKSGGWYYLDLDNPNKKKRKEGGYLASDVLAAINTAKSGINVTM